MKTQPTTLRRPSPLRRAFTLVELLIVITVIGILVGLLLPAISGAMNSARELAIRAEMVQIEQGIESFKTQYGFYPPSFEQFGNSAPLAAALSPNSPGLSEFLQYLNRIAPNHQERTNFAGGGVRAVVWWNKIGRHLDQQSSLVFWLSGLCKSKQFPLTGGAAGLIEPFNGPTRYVGNGTLNPAVEIERDVIFDFQPGQLVYGVGPNIIVRDPNGSVLTPDVSNAVTDLDRDPDTFQVNFVELDEVTPGGNVPLVAAYQQAHGPSSGDKLFRYRDASSYTFAPFAYATQVPGGANDSRGRNSGDDLVQDDFVNPKTFQLISAGMDGELGVPENPTGAGDVRHLRAYVFSSDPNFVKRGYDNQANFASGRLELYIIEYGN